MWSKNTERNAQPFYDGFDELEAGVVPLLCRGLVLLRVTWEYVGDEAIDGVGDAIWSHGCIIRETVRTNEV